MKEEYEIEKGVPIPIKTTKYPLHDLKVGDSFEVHDEPDPRKLRGSVYQHGRRYGVGFTVMKTGEESYRVWRTS